MLRAKLEFPVVMVGTRFGQSAEPGAARPRTSAPENIMRETDIYHPAPPDLPPHTTTAFARPLWARARVLSDSSPRVDTGELRRPIKTGDSTPQVSTADLLRPRWAAKAS